jgi:hypothetical protein
MNTSRRVVILAVLCIAAFLGVAPASALAATTPNPGQVDFGNVGVHNGNQQRNVSFTNDGAAPLTLAGAAVSGSDAGAYNVTSDGCFNATLDPGDTCDVSVAFDPDAVRSFSASLDMTDSDSSTSVALTGAGITGTLSANPPNFTPAPLMYGGQQQGINLQNSNDAATQATSMSITGPDAANFYIAWDGGCSNSHIFNNGDGCGMGVGYTPDHVGTYNAQLVVVSDSSASPLIVPLSAQAFAGGKLQASPAEVAFGDVGVGSEASQVVTMTNIGDFPSGVNQQLVVTGHPDVFYTTDDTCTGRLLNPADTCTVTVHFKPTAIGAQDASLFLITAQETTPVRSIGINGNATIPAVALSENSRDSDNKVAALSGVAAAGKTLTCRAPRFTSSAAPSYAWLRNAKVVAGAAEPTLALTNSDVGARFSCRASAGDESANSPASAPVIARDLSNEPNSFTDTMSCRTVAVTRLLSIAGNRTTVSYGQPVVPSAPLSFSSNLKTRVRIDGKTMGFAHHVTVSPRALSRLADGQHTVSVSSGTRRAQATLLLAPCKLALRLSATSITVSARTGLGTLAVKLGARMSLHASGPPRKLGRFTYQTADRPSVTFALTGQRTSYNGVTVTVTRHGMTVRGLPAEVGTVRVSLNAGVLHGAGHSHASARSRLRGDSGATVARASTA